MLLVQDMKNMRKIHESVLHFAKESGVFFAFTKEGEEEKMIHFMGDAASFSDWEDNDDWSSEEAPSFP